MAKLPMEMEIGVRQLNFMPKVVTHKNNIYITNQFNYVLESDVNTDLERIAMKFSFDMNSEHKRWNPQMNSIVH